MPQPFVEQLKTEMDVFTVKPGRVIPAKNHSIFRYQDIKHKEEMYIPAE